MKRSRRNVSVRTATRTVIAKALRSVEAGDPGMAAVAVQDANSTLDRAVQKGIMHKNTAARRKSRISARLNKL